MLLKLAIGPSGTRRHSFISCAPFTAERWAYQRYTATSSQGSVSGVDPPCTAASDESSGAVSRPVLQPLCDSSQTTESEFVGYAPALSKYIKASICFRTCISFYSSRQSCNSQVFSQRSSPFPPPVLLYCLNVRRPAPIFSWHASLQHQTHAVLDCRAKRALRNLSECVYVMLRDGRLLHTHFTSNWVELLSSSRRLRNNWCSVQPSNWEHMLCWSLVRID